MISSYQEALKYLYDNLPMFQRLGAVAIRKDLTNTIHLCSILGDPQLTFRSVHVAGTNGKGSTSHMLASIMHSAGYRTGLYTSPHLKEFTERIKINGEEISRDYVVDFVNRIRPAIEQIRPSFFEITVAMAFDYFAQKKVDIAIIEVGLGGRLDSTNVITPLLSVITNISFDHKDLLGETLPEIAAEKAGIIKKTIPVVISERQPKVEHVFVSKANDENAKIFFASDEYSAVDGAGGTVQVLDRAGRTILENIDLPLHGDYQKRNLPGVLRSVDLLRSNFQISEVQLKRGLEQTVENTGLKGRWQILYTTPTVVCDTGHNEGGIREVLLQISRQNYRQLFFVLGMVKDKDVRNILSMLPKEAVYFFCQAKIPRALDAAILQQEASAFGLRGSVVRDVNEAKRSAMSLAGKDDFVFIGGSTYVVGELEEL